MINLLPSHNTRRAFKESPTLSESNASTISQNDFFVVSLDERFIPYDFAEIINQSTTSDVTLFVNQTQQFKIPKGNKRTISDRIIRDLRIRNDSATDVSIGNIQVIYRKTSKQGEDLIAKGSAAINIAGALSSALRFFK